MAFTHTLTKSWSSGAGNLQKQVSQTADGENNRDAAIGASATVEIAIAFAFAALKMFYVLSDVAGTLVTNSSGSPVDSIPIAAGQPFMWNSDSGETNPFGTNVTKFFFINGGATAGTCKVRALVDATP